MAVTQVLPICLGELPGTNSSFPNFRQIFDNNNTWTTAGTGTNQRVPVAADGTFGQMYVELNTAPGSGKSWTFVIVVDGVDSACSVTIADTNTTGNYTGSAVSVTAGQHIYLKATSSGTPTGAGQCHISVVFTSSNAGEAIHGGTPGGANTFATERFTGAFRANVWTSTRAQAEQVVAAAGNVTALHARCSTLGGSETVTLSIYKNGVRQDGTGGTVDTRLVLTSANTAGGSVTFTLPCAKGDRLCIAGQETTNPPGSADSLGVGLRFTATVDGQSNFAGNHDQSVSLRTAAGSSYSAVPRGWSGISTTEAAGSSLNVGAQKHVGVSFDLRELEVYVTNAPGSGKSWTFYQRVAGSRDGCTVTIADTAQSGSDLVNAATVASGVLLSLEHAPANTPTSSTRAAWTFVQGPPSVTTVDPGGTVPPGTNPPQGTQPGANPPQGIQASSFPLLFLELKNASTTTAYAETTLNDRAEWWHGQKTARILRISPIRRALSRDGGFEVSTCTVELADTDRSFREAARTTTLTGQYGALYVVDDETRRAEGEPYRIFAGMVSAHRALPGFRYELQIEDVLGTRFAEAFRQPTIPSFILTASDFPVMDATREGGAAPVALGELSDATATSPQGIVPAIYLGWSNLQTLSNNTAAVNTLVDAFIFCQNACASIPGIYYNDPSTPSLRHLAPSTAAGSLFWAPHWPAWSQTGYTANYADWPNSTSGYRFTPIFLPRGTDVASAAISGTMLITANVVGTEEYGDSTGAAITVPERLIQHVLTNYVFTEYRVGSYAPVPFFPANSYTILDTSTVENALYAAFSMIPTGSPVAGILLGDGGQQRDAYGVLRDLLQGSDLDMGVNRHGQIILSREAVSATPVMSFTASDILMDSFEAWTETGESFNRLDYQYGYRYIAPSAPLPTPSVGAPLPINPVASYNPFVSGLVRMEATSAQSLVGRRQTYTLDNYVTRAQSWALTVGSTIITRALGPSNDGPHMVRFATGWQGFGKNQVDVDLGSVITVDHPEGLSSTGYTAKRVRVLAVEVDPQNATVTLEGRVL